MTSARPSALQRLQARVERIDALLVGAETDKKWTAVAQLSHQLRMQEQALLDEEARQESLQSALRPSDEASSDDELLHDLAQALLELPDHIVHDLMIAIRDQGRGHLLDVREPVEPVEVAP